MARVHCRAQWCGCVASGDEPGVESAGGSLASAAIQQRRRYAFRAACLRVWEYCFVWLDAYPAQVFYRQGLTPTQSLKRTWGGFLRTPNLQNARHLQKQTNIARSKDGDLCR
jgi:hypothetical protein